MLLLVLFVEMTLGFHCVAFFVHLSSLCEAFLMANRHVNFCCVSIHYVVLTVCMFFHLSCAPFDKVDPVLLFIIGSARVVVRVVFLPLMSTVVLRTENLARPFWENVASSDVCELWQQNVKSCGNLKCFGQLEHHCVALRLTCAETNKVNSDTGRVGFAIIAADRGCTSKNATDHSLAWSSRPLQVCSAPDRSSPPRHQPDTPPLHVYLQFGTVRQRSLSFEKRDLGKTKTLSGVSPFATATNSCTTTPKYPHNMASVSHNLDAACSTLQNSYMELAASIPHNGTLVCFWRFAYW